MTTVTIKSLLEHCGLNESDLSSRIEEAHFLEISRCLREWRLLALKLPELEGEWGDIEVNCSLEKSRRLEFVKLLDQKLPLTATYGLLVRKLIEIGRAHDALSLCNHLKTIIPASTRIVEDGRTGIQQAPTTNAITPASARIAEDSRTGIQQAPTTNDKESEEVVRKVVQDQTEVDIYIARLNFLGLPRSGKSTTMKRLIGEIVDIVTAGWTKELKSTGAAERNQAFVCRKVSKQFTFGWSKCDLSKETAILKYLMEQAVKAAADKQKSEESDAQKVLSKGIDQEHIEDVSSGETHTDVTDVVSIFQNAVANEEWDKLKFALNDTVYWINTDTGGQTAFLELMSRFILGPSLNLIFSRLTDPLEKEYKIYATSKVGKHTEKEDSIVKLEDTLFQALASITCMEVPYQSNEKSKEAAKKDEVPNTMSKAMFVGTFRDKVTPDEFLKRDQNLREKIEQSEFCSKRIVEYSSEDHLIFALNNESGGQEEVDMMREIFERKFKKFKKIRIPAPWLMLSICMRHTKQRTMTFEQCEEIAGKLGIASESLEEVLQFLHYRVGVLLYYPEVEGFENIIILDIQLVFEVATQLIKKTFTFEKVGTPAAKRFKEEAKFTIADIHDAAADEDKDSIPVKKLVHLLEHHKILAKLDEEDIYFMPCVLKNATEVELKNPKCSDHIAPLMICYECGYMPLGIFSTLITALLSKKKEDKWKCVGDCRRNKVEFQVGADRDDLTLIGRPTFMEVHLYRETKQHNAQVCSDICVTLVNTLNEVHTCMKYCSSGTFQYRFKCPRHPKQQDHLSEISGDYLHCLENPKKSCRSIRKEEKFTNWLGEGTSSAIKTPTSVEDSGPGIQQVQTTNTIPTPPSARIVEDSGMDIQEVQTTNNIGGLGYPQPLSMSDNHCYAATASCSTVRKSQRKAAKTTASCSTVRRSQRKAAKRKLSDCDGVIRSSSKRQHQNIDEEWSDLRIVDAKDIEDSMYYTRLGPPEIKFIHEKGINGNGISLAIIDSYDGDTNIKGGFQKEHATFHKSKLEIIDMTDDISKTKCKTSSHALNSVAIAVGKEFEACYLSKFSEDNLKLDYPGGIAPLADCTVLLINHKDDNYKSVKKALDFVTKKKRFDVVSMSFGRPELGHLEKHIRDLGKTNTIIVAAAGNGGGWDGVVYPAAYEEVISVGSWNTRLKLSSFSPPLEDVDVNFYGELMVPHRDATKKFLKFCTGTSIAAPGIAGVICLILQCAKKHKLDLSRVKQKDTLLEILKDMTMKGKKKFTHFSPKKIVEAFTDRKYICSFLD